MAEWSCTKERINERRPNILVEWSCSIKRNKSVGTLNSGRMAVHIASAKILESEGSVSPSSFYGQLPNYKSHLFSLIYPVDEFSLKEMRTWVSTRFHFIVFVFGVNKRIRRWSEFKIPLCNPNGGRLLTQSHINRVTLKISPRSTTELLCENSQRA